MRIASDVYQFGRLRGMGAWGANVYLLAGETLTLIDTGYKGRATRMLKDIKSLGYSPTDIKNIIITHHHVDHTGSLAVLKEVTRAKVIAHFDDAPYIDGTLPQPGPANPEWLGGMLSPVRSLWSSRPVKVDVPVSDGDYLTILNGIRIIHTPGHTPGSISLFLEMERLLIVGDLLVNTVRLGFPSKMFTEDLSTEISSIKKVTALNFNTICFGHGAAIKDNARQVVSDFAVKIVAKRIPR